MVKIEIDPEKLYYNMVDARLHGFISCLSGRTSFQRRKGRSFYHQCKASGTVRRREGRYIPTIPVPAAQERNIRSAAEGTSDREKEKGIAGSSYMMALRCSFNASVFKPQPVGA